MKKAIILLFFLHSLGLFSQDQGLKFSRFTEEDGLPGNNVFCFLKDSRGFMWMGTTEGLSRFDGYDFKEYRKNPLNKNSISADDLTALMEDSDGLIWIGTNTGGLNSFDPETGIFQSYLFNPDNKREIPGDRIRRIIQADDGTIWIGFDNGIGLSKFNKETQEFTNYNPFEGIADVGVNAIRSMQMDRWDPNRLWLATTKGLISFDIQKERFNLIDHPLKEARWHGTWVLDQLDNGQILVGFFHIGLDIYDVKSDTWLGRSIQPVEEIRIYDLAKKSKNEYWVAVRKRGLAIYDVVTGNLEFVPSELNNFNSPFPGFTYTVYANDNELWVGGKYGVSYLNTNPSLFPFEKLNFTHEEFGRVSCVSSKFDKIYIGAAYTTGLWEIDKKTGVKTVHKIDDRETTVITSLLELEKKVILIDNYKRLLEFDKQTKLFQYLELGEELKPEYSIRGLEEYTDDSIFITTIYGGTFVLNLSSYEVQPLFDLVRNSSRIHNHIKVRKGGSIWIGTQTDVTIYNPQTDSITFYRPASIASLNEKNVFVLEEDKDENMWIGTSSGLIRLSDGEETLLNSANSELPTYYVSNIVFDAQDDLWVGTLKGISEINKTDLSVRNFDRQDGLDFAGVLDMVDEKFIVGSYGGFSLFHPDSIYYDLKLPEVYVTNFKVLEEERRLTTTSGKSRIDLSYKENAISFSFSSPTFSRPQKVQYAYQMIGVDNDWVNSGSRRYVSYTNLDGGRYTFQAKARNRDGKWGDPQIIELYIASPYWETWWFYAICSVVILGSAFTFYKFRINTLHRKADQEAQELRLEAFQKRLMELNATPPDLTLDFADLNSKLNSPLSEREFEALELSLDGKTNAEIAEALFISNSTVKFHLRNTYGKLGVTNRKEAFQFILKKT